MRKASVFLALTAGAALGMSACGDDDDGDSGNRGDAGPSLDAAVDAGSGADGGDAGAGQQAVTLRFKGKVGAADLVCGNTYPGQGSANTTITPRDFRFFVHNVRLISSTGAEVPVTLDAPTPAKYQTKDIALIDFNDGTGDCDIEDTGTNMVITGTVPVGQYTGVAFTPGVPEALNHADPALMPGPLQAAGASWGWVLGYRFVMAEVLASSPHTSMDAGAAHGAGDGGTGHSAGDGGAGHGAGDGGAGHGPARAGLGFIHLGSGGCSGTQGQSITCTKANRPEVRLMNFNLATGSIVADLGAVFSKADLGTSVQCHGSGPACAPMFEALGVDINTGNALTTQQVFRAE